MMTQRYGEVFDELQGKPLTEGIDRDSFVALMTEWCPRLREYHSGETIFHSRDDDGFFHVLVTGAAHMFQEDFLGGRTLIKPKFAGEVLSIGIEEPSGIGMQYMLEAMNDCTVISFESAKVMDTHDGNPVHVQLLVNLVRLLTAGHYHMFMHLMQLSRRTTREKLLSYFSSCAQAAGDSSFTVPYNRQQLADYLCIDRSAMCTELKNMQEAGFIIYDGRDITLLDVTDRVRLMA